MLYTLNTYHLYRSSTPQYCWEIKFKGKKKKCSETTAFSAGKLFIVSLEHSAVGMGVKSETKASQEGNKETICLKFFLLNISVWESGLDNTNI